MSVRALWCCRRDIKRRAAVAFPSRLMYRRAVSAPPAAGLAVMGNLLEYFSLTKTKFQPKIYAVTILRKLLTKLK